MKIEATVRREGDLWVIDIEGWGVTQARSLDEVEVMVLDYIDRMRQRV